MDETCEQRIGAQMASREAYVAAMLAVVNGEEVDSPHTAELDLTADADGLAEEAREALDNLPLSVDTITTMRVDLSTGGPADYLTAEIEEGQHSWERTSNVVYHFADWFDHAAMVLGDDSSLAQWFDSMIDLKG